MVAYTSAANGEWNVDATWGGGGHPQAGDTATINHNVYVDSNVVVGNSPANDTTYVVLINNGGVLRWENPPSGNWTFECRGNIRVAEGGTFTVGTIASPILAANTADVYFPMAGAWHWRIYNQGGVVEICGASAYHMADANKQRTRLSASCTSGAVTFTVEDGVDWSTNDYVVIGHGGNAATAMVPATYQSERVQVTKVTASSYSAVLAYAHQAGDFIFNTERNVRVRGLDNTHGIRLYSTHGASATAANAKTCLSWMKFRYGGTTSSDTYSAVVHQLQSTSQAYSVSADNFCIDSVVFDESGARGASVSTAQCITLNNTVPYADPECISNVHAFDFDRTISIGASFLYELTVRKLTAVRIGGASVYNLSARLTLDEYWYNNNDWTNAASYGVQGTLSQLSNFKFHCGYIGCQTSGSSAVVAACEMAITQGAIQHFYTHGLYINFPQHMKVKNVDFYECRNTGYMSANFHPRAKFVGCNFDKCGFNNASNDGAISGMDAYVENCTFGLNSRNTRNNIVMYNGGATYDPSGRVIARNCAFKEPLNWSATIGVYRYYKKAMFWSVAQYNMQDWRGRVLMNVTPGEIRDCTVIDSTGVDQWAIDYGSSVTQIINGCCGGEVRNNPAPSGGWLDSTFQRAILPFHGSLPMQMNRHLTIRIPATAGQTVTVNLSMRKIADGKHALPNIRLEGPGIYSTATMTAGLLNTWEELTVSGVATHTGTCQLFVSGGSSISGYGSIGNGGVSWTNDPQAAPVGLNEDEMFGVTVYADGLLISITGP